MYIAEYEKLLTVAEQISREWGRTDYNHEVFADVVNGLTRGLDLAFFGELQNLHHLGLDPRVADLQWPSTFSDCYFKLYDDGHYWVEVLNWWTSDVNVHDHDFSGVQVQLAGRSLNVTYKFVSDGLVGGAERGRFDVNEATVWHPGSSSLIVAGDSEPHSVCHVDMPTVSLLFRTHPIPALGPQNNYFPPFMRGSYRVATMAMRTRLKMLRLMARYEPDNFQTRFWETVPTQTVQENLFTLVKLADVLFVPQYTDLLTRFADSDIAEARSIVAAVANHRSSDYLKSLMRNRLGPSQTDGLAIASLASAWDEASLTAITTQLAGYGWDIEPSAALTRAAADGVIRGQQDVARVMRRFQGEPLRTA